MPALVVCTQALGEPRYPSLKGIMGARTKEITTQSLADLRLDAGTLGGASAVTAVQATKRPPARDATKVVRGSAEEGAAAIVELLTIRRII